MKSTDTYLALKAMLCQGWLKKETAEFEQLLKTLEQKKLITATEHHDLIALSKQATPALPR